MRKLQNFFSKGLPIKDVRSQGRRGFSDADVFLVQKIWNFRNLWWVCTDKGEEGSASADKGGVNFSRFCEDVSMDGPKTINLLSFLTVLLILSGEDY